MGAFVLRRLVLFVLLIAGFSAISFVLLASQFPSPIAGRSAAGEYAHWLAGLPSGRSLRSGLLNPQGVR